MTKKPPSVLKPEHGVANDESVKQKMSIVVTAAVVEDMVSVNLAIPTGLI